ncbi:MAG: DNA/RNA non-specific endonuclease [Acutalibacteraceae bacterium]|nr:DNA/RNA non-specific endonuclease [Acutalibacteraceae bacterium]
MKTFIKSIIGILLILCLIFCYGCTDGTVTDSSVQQSVEESYISNNSSVINSKEVDVASIPEFDGKTAYIVINNNVPSFDGSSLLKATSFEEYSQLDKLGRCGVAIACVGKDIMPTEERGSIGQVKPTGWHTVKYDCVDGKYLYNRCHLIGYQLTGENANEKNLITGTRYLNIEGMLPFENLIADYVKETNNHVLYRVTPIFNGDNLLANGVQMEGYSIEDNGEGVCFNVYAYNAQPDIVIDYSNGESYYKGKSNVESTAESQTEDKVTYTLNVNTKKIHLSDCRYANEIKEENKKLSNESIDTLENNGYTCCKVCLKDR